MEKTTILSLCLAVLFTSSCGNHSSNRNDSKTDTDDNSVSFNFSDEDSANYNDPAYITEHKKIGIGESKSAGVYISVPAGILAIKGGAKDLAEVAVKYKSNLREFNISQELEGDHLKAHISMPYLEGIKEIKDEGSICSIRLNEKIPLDLDIDFGAGKGKFDLGSLKTDQIKMGLGAGEFIINLVGSPVANLKVDAGVGKATIDISGAHKKDLDAAFNCGIGSLILELPKETGVRVDVNGLLGDIDSGDLIKKGDFWYNAAWDKDGPRIRIRINGGIGDINFKTKP
jgi:hypothetical protein